MEQHGTTCAFCALVLSYVVLCESLCCTLCMFYTTYTIYTIIHIWSYMYLYRIIYHLFGASIRFVTSVLRTALRASVQSAPALQTLKGFPAAGNAGNAGKAKVIQVKCHETREVWLCPSHWKFQLHFLHMTCLFTFKTSPERTREKRVHDSMEAMRHKAGERVRLHVAHSALLSLLWVRLWFWLTSLPPLHLASTFPSPNPRLMIMMLTVWAEKVSNLFEVPREENMTHTTTHQAEQVAHSCTWRSASVCINSFFKRNRSGFTAITAKWVPRTSQLQLPHVWSILGCTRLSHFESELPNAVFVHSSRMFGSSSSSLSVQDRIFCSLHILCLQSLKSSQEDWT